MYVDKERDRILLRDGISIVSSEKICEKMLLGEDISNLRVEDCRDSELFQYVNGRVIDTCPVTDVVPPRTEEGFDDIDLPHLLDILKSLPRFEISEDFTDRIIEELDFFHRSGTMGFIVSLIQLISDFKEDGVVWGVGRGSSCASLLMYLIEVNDINPLLFDIPFNEMSKEDLYDEI